VSFFPDSNPQPGKKPPFVPPPPAQPFGEQPFGPPPSPGFGAGGAYPPPGAAGPYAYTPNTSRTSLLALASLITGLGSWLLCCCAPLMIVPSLMAVATGHLGLREIHRGGGQVSGTPLAILGLVSGYMGLLFCILFLAIGFLHDPKPAEMNSTVTAENVLSSAERKIVSDSGGTAHGNSPEAKALAEKYSASMLALREAFFTPNKPGGISLSGGQFIVWCELRDGQCAFVVHVPSYPKFDGDAKDSLAKLAWLAAQESVAGTLQEGDDLAVGLKGTLLYGAVMVGSVGDKAGPDEQSKDKELLYPFFEPPADAPPVGDMKIELPAEKPAEDAKEK